MKTWIITIVITDTPDFVNDEDYYTEKQIINQFDSMDLEAGLTMTEITAELQ